MSSFSRETPRTEDAIISHGERFSTLLFSAAAGNAGLDVVRVDATKVIITDARYRMARPDRTEILARVPATLRPLIEANRIPVIEGFIGATHKGTPTTMGFEASDYTASLLGAALDASEIQIWTDVQGILTTGSPGIENVLSIAELSFDEAAELSFFGAKVLHPRTIDPAADRNIPVRILHSRHPEDAGTTIFGTPEDLGSTVKSIVLKEDVVVVHASSPRPVPAHRTMAFIGETLDRHEVSPHLLAISGHRVGFGVAAETEIGAVLGELSETLQVSQEEGCVIVTLVGSDTGKAPDVAARAIETIRGIPILLMPYGASDTSLSLAVSERYSQEVVVKLHREFFGAGKPDTQFAQADGEVQP